VSAAQLRDGADPAARTADDDPELAESVERTHSAVSQKVATMRTAGSCAPRWGLTPGLRVALTARASGSPPSWQWVAGHRGVVLELEAELPTR
jgi:hypothetical protein